MTRPRLSPSREIFGILGPFPRVSAVLQEWNACFRSRDKDAVLVRYTATEENLPERLSEMFHFDRRAYLVGDALGRACLPLLDRLEESAKESQRVNLIWNEQGVLVGTVLTDEDFVEQVLHRSL